MTDDVSLSDKTSVGMPIRNLIGLIGTVCVGAWGYFGILERLNVVETNQILMSADVTKNSTFTEKMAQRRIRRSSCRRRAVHAYRASLW